MNSADNREAREDILCTLLAARTLIDVEGWCTRNSAQDRDGNCVSAYSPKAVAYCTVGAVRAVTESARLDDMYQYAAREALESVTDPRLGSWNDAPGRTKAQVLKAFDKAISKLEREMEC